MVVKGGERMYNKLMYAEKKIEKTFFSIDSRMSEKNAKTNTIRVYVVR